jgi:diaminohydroxyphosphoribosylaminopyrimidine deaminase/5-amino-6-(5-phosphoribosylamino)uracil reductase
MMIKDDEYFMGEAMALAEKSIGHTSPNPMVGAVLVHDGEIIGQGYHMKYGEAHAEVNCINSVAKENQHLIKESVLYVTLEPCAHHGKTPPCVDLIIANEIKEVVIAALDPFEEVNGRGIEILQAAGIKVKTEVLQFDARFLNRRFFWYHENKQPYIILKWAETADGFMASSDNERLIITGEASNMLVHQWRSEEDAIMIGSRTAILDDPLLTVRHVEGPSPIRIVINTDDELRLSLKMFNDGLPTIVFNTEKEEVQGLVVYKKVDIRNGPDELLFQLYEMKIQSVMVEGGARLLQYFLNHACWHEIRRITNTTMILGAGINTPDLPDDVETVMDQMYGNDRVRVMI